MIKSVLELFSGSGDISKRFSSFGWDSISIDYNPKCPSDLHMDVYSLPLEFFRMFDFIWASPDCTTYSLAARNIHRVSGGVPVSEYAKQCDCNNEVLVKSLLASGKPFIIENPRAHLRHMDFMVGLYRLTVYYSAYGAPYSKPTDLFSNFDLSKYFNQDIVHTHVHLDWIKGYGDFLGRCHMPSLLIDDIVKCAEDVCGASC